MSELPDPGASRAVLIGTSQYDHLEPLPTVANNLTALAEALASPACWGLPPQNCAIISDPMSSEEVMAAVRDSGKQARDTLFVYYAGHGLVDPQGGLFLGRPQTKQQLVETGLPYDWLRQALSGSQAERHVVVLDCCYGGLALGTMGGGASELVNQATVEGSYLLAAASETRPALAPAGETYTAFTAELLDVLRSGIRNGPELLELDVVYRHLRLSLGAKGRPLPQARNRNTGGRLALGRNQAFLPAQPVSVSAPDLDRRKWPQPTNVRTAEGFIEKLADVRRVSGLTQEGVSRRSGGEISKSTVSALSNRTALPKTWKTTAIYLSACGVPEDQVAQWKSAWQRLRAESSRPAPEDPPAHEQQQQTRPPTAGIWGKLTRRIQARGQR